MFLISKCRGDWNLGLCIFGLLRKEIHCEMQNSDFFCWRNTFFLGVAIAQQFSFKVPKKCTDLDLSLLYISILGTYSKFTRKNSLLAPGVCFPQPCSSAGRRFAASRSRSQYYRRIISFPQQKIDEMRCKLDSTEKFSHSRNTQPRLSGLYFFLEPEKEYTFKFIENQPSSRAPNAEGQGARHWGWQAAREMRPQQMMLQSAPAGSAVHALSQPPFSVPFPLLLCRHCWTTALWWRFVKLEENHYYTIEFGSEPNSTLGKFENNLL